MDLSQRQIEILDATLEIITEKSLDAVSIRNIANKVGITEPAIYRHFKSKKDLILKLAVYFRKNWEIIMKKMRNPALSGIKELEHILSSCIKNFSQNEVYPSFFISVEKMASSPQVKREIREIFTLVINVLEEPIKRGQQEGNIRSDLSSDKLARVILNMIMSLLFYWKLGTEEYSLKKNWEESWQIIELFFNPAN